MQYRRFGRTGWNVSEIGYGMWGMGSWTGTHLDEVQQSLDRAVELGCNFFDTAWAYGGGKSEKILAALTKRHTGKKLYCASKIPAKNFKWPAKPEYRLQDCYPASHIVDYTEKSLRNLGMECIDLQQFHVWDDSWTNHDDWKEGIQRLKKDGKIRNFGISINRWEPENGLEALETGLVDTVQVIYNIFDQAPEDQLFPLCRELDIGVIARVPFDEGTLTGMLTKETVFPRDDWRSTYFVPENLSASVSRADALRKILPDGVTMAEIALRFILDNDDVHTTIPGMRKMKHVESNIGVSDGKRLPETLRNSLREHRWDRVPNEWSQ